MNKKAFIVLGCSFFIVVLLVLYVLSSPRVSYDKDSFINNRESYESIALYCEECFKNKNVSNSDVLIYAFGDDKQSIYCVNDHTSTKLNDTLKNDFIIIKNIFVLDSQHLDCLYVNKDYVSFTIESGRASFIYSLNNSAPSFINNPRETVSHLYVKKIVDNWYFACNQD